MRKKLLTGALALALGFTTVFSGVTPATVKAAETATTQAEDSYVYCYAELTWAEYWANEDVYANTNTTSENDIQDSHSEYDLGGFDAVTRATTNHGLHRGSYQCTTEITATSTTDATKTKIFKVSHWSGDGKTLYTSSTDKTGVAYSRGTITDTDGTKYTLDEYQVLGTKYVPVAVKSSDFSAFKAKYTVVENGGTLVGGYGEAKLSAYTATANVTANTNGLKVATKNADGSFSFGAMKTDGTDSGIKDQALKTVDESKATVEVKESPGSYGELIRVDITGDAYGDLGANMQSVTWTYYGDDSTYTKALKSYGTKFAADNWMHKSNGIQLGLTKSARFALPDNTDGSGYWTVTVHALGYKDYTMKINVTEDNLSKNRLATDEEKASFSTSANELKEQVSKLTKSDYSTKSWSSLQTELDELDDLLAKQHPYILELNEQLEHVENAIKSLVTVKDALAEAVASAKELKEADYTADSWKALQSALKTAEEALANTETAPTQAQLDALTNAQEALVSVKDALTEAVASAKELKETDYTTDSWKALQSALKTAEEALANTETAPTQAQLDALTNAKAALVSIKTLNEAVTSAKELKETDYTADSWKAFQTALTTSENVLANAAATQEDVDAQVTALNKAVSALVKKPATTEKKSDTTTAKKTDTTTAKKTNTTTLKKGTKVTDKSSKAVYKVTGAATVEYTKPSNKKATSASVPATIKANGKTYKVTSIAAKAFYKNTKLKKVTIGSNIKKIGKQAFFGCKNLKKITIKTKSLKKSTVGSKAFKGINKKATIKVPKKQKKAYKKILKAKGIGSKVKVK